MEGLIGICDDPIVSQFIQIYIGSIAGNAEVSKTSGCDPTEGSTPSRCAKVLDY